MTDDRFFRRAGPFRLGEIAAHVGGEMDNRAASDFLVRDVDALESAAAGDISVFSDAKFASAFAHTGASVVITDRKLSSHEHNGTWVLMDFGDVVVHVFQEEARQLYDIEGLWLDARRLPVPVPDRP